MFRSYEGDVQTEDITQHLRPFYVPYQQPRAFLSRPNFVAFNDKQWVLMTYSKLNIPEGPYTLHISVKLRSQLFRCIMSLIRSKFVVKSNNGKSYITVYTDIIMDFKVVRYSVLNRLNHKDLAQGS